MDQLPENQAKAYTLQVTLFKVADPQLGYGPDNRVMLRSVNFGTIDASERATYEDAAFIRLIEPLFPYSVYSPDRSYREIVASSHAALRNQRTSEGYPCYFMALRGSATLADYIKQAQKKRLPKKKDPDSYYFPMTGPAFVGRERRYEVERANPYVYGQYELRTACGCEHKESGVLIKCSCGALAGCEECHDSELFTHSVRVVAYQCRHCGYGFETYCQNCPRCSALLTQHFCEKCKIYDMSDPEFMPYCHCPCCNVCHPKMTEKVRRHCEVCGTCYNLEDFATHSCSRDGQTCMACAGSILPHQDVRYLACSSNHKLHAGCYYALLDYNNYWCPMCRKIMLDEDIIVQRKLAMVSYFLALKIHRIQPAAIRLRCNDCNAEFYDFHVLFCHLCNGFNIEFTYIEEYLEYKDIYDILNGKSTFERYSELYAYIGRYGELYYPIKAYVIKVLVLTHGQDEQAGEKQ